MTLDKAIRFATKAHSGQVRRYTGEPYITHPMEVMSIVATVPHSEAMLQAAVLHDVVEDTPISIDEICDNFGPVVGMYVEYSTDISTLKDGNRATRKAKDAWHYARGPAESQTIKVADLIHNTADIARHDRQFWEVYKVEKMHVLEVCTKADAGLRQKAISQVKELW